MIDLTSYSIGELEALLKTITNEIIRRKSTDLIGLRAQIDELLKVSGYSLEDLLKVTSTEKNFNFEAKEVALQASKQDRLLDSNNHASLERTEQQEPSEDKHRQPTKAKAAVKYQDPENPENKWSGRGKTPKWLQEKLLSGAEKENFLIDTDRNT